MADEDGSTRKDDGGDASSDDVPILEETTVSFDELEPATGEIELLQLEPLAAVEPITVVAPLPVQSPAPTVVPVIEPDRRAAAPQRGGRRSARSAKRRVEAPPKLQLAPEPEVEVAPIAPPLGAATHAEMHVKAHYEYTSLPVDDPPTLAVLLEMDALGEPLVKRDAGPVAHVILALDMSASMNDPEKYPVLRDAVGSMLDDLHADGAADVILSVVIFSKGADVIVRNVIARNVRKDRLFASIEKHALCFGRYTDIAGALGRAGKIAYEQCKATRALPVRVYLLTDGRPQDMERAREMADRLGKVPADVHALAFGADADVAVLQSLFAGKRGGTVKSVRTETISTAFERVAEVAQQVLATRCIVTVDLELGVVGGDAFRYRPARARFQEPAFAGGKRFRADLGTIESKRTYSLVFELRPPERDETVTRLGRVTVAIPGVGGPIVSEVELTLARTPEGSAPGDIDTAVRTAHDILGALTDDDPEVALRALRLRLDLYVREKRDPGLIRIITNAIEALERDGSLDALAAGDLATLRAHTCTASGGDEDLAYLRG